MLSSYKKCFRLGVTVCAALFVLVTSGVAEAGVVVTDGKIGSQLTGDEVNPPNRSGTKATKDDDGQQAQPLTADEQAVFIYASAVLNGHYADVDDDMDDESVDGPGPIPMGIPMTIVANLDADDVDGGCAATPLSLLAALACGLIAWRRRRR